MRKHKAWVGKKRVTHHPLSGAGNMQGRGTRKIVLHTSESDPGSINGVVSWVAKQRSGYHLVIDDKAKKAVQLFPFNKSARAMLHGFDPYGCNMQGAVCIQICIVGRAHNNPVAHLSPWARKLIVDIARSWDVPIVVRNNGRSKTTWVHKSGFYGHKNAVNNDHNDPGRIPGKKYWLRGLRQPSAPKVTHHHAQSNHKPNKPAPTSHTAAHHKYKVILAPGVRPAKKKLMRRAHKAAQIAKHDMLIKSGDRNPREAWVFRMRYLNGGVLAALCCNIRGKHSWARCGKSPHSNHARGRAIDCGFLSHDGKKYTSFMSFPNALHIARAAGLKAPMWSPWGTRIEDWHMELA